MAREMSQNDIRVRSQNTIVFIVAFILVEMLVLFAVWWHMSTVYGVG